MSLRALIIDDEPLARQELQYLLERAGGVDVLAQGTNGIEAVELIRAFAARQAMKVSAGTFRDTA